MASQISLRGSSGVHFELNEHELHILFNVHSRRTEDDIVKTSGAFSSNGWKYTLRRSARPNDEADYWLAPDGFAWHDFLPAVRAFFSYYMGSFEAAPEAEALHIDSGQKRKVAPAANFQFSPYSMAQAHADL